MEYHYHILNEVYNWMISRQKDIEVRILKEKSSKIQIGDYITFHLEEDESKYVKVKVINKDIFNNSDELLNKYNVNRMMPNHTKEELQQLLIKIYKDELENKKLVAFTFEYIASDQDE